MNIADRLVCENGHTGITIVLLDGTCVVCGAEFIQAKETGMTTYRDRLLAGLYDPDEEKRAKAAAKLDKQQRETIKAAQQEQEEPQEQETAAYER